MYYKDFWYTQTSKYFVAKTTKLTDDFGFMHVFSSRHFVATKFILCKSRSELFLCLRSLDLAILLKYVVHLIPTLSTFWFLKNAVLCENWQCCLADSSKVAPRILIFSIVKGAPLRCTTKVHH